MKRKILLPLMLVLLLAAPGCYLLDTQTDSTGKQTTNLEVALAKTVAVIGTVAPIANAFVPGVGTVAGGVGVLLSLVGGLVTSVIVAKKRGGALAAVVAGVESAGHKDTKMKIKEIAGDLGIEPFLNKIVKKYYPV